MHPKQYQQLMDSSGQQWVTPIAAAPPRRAARVRNPRRSTASDGGDDDSAGDEEPAGRWLRTRPAARHLGIGFSTLNKLRLTGDGPRFAKLGAVVVYDRNDLDAWATERKIGSTSERVRAA